MKDDKDSSKVEKKEKIEITIDDFVLTKKLG